MAREKKPGDLRANLPKTKKLHKYTQGRKKEMHERTDNSPGREGPGRGRASNEAFYSRSRTKSKKCDQVDGAGLRLAHGIVFCIGGSVGGRLGSV